MELLEKCMLCPNECKVNRLQGIVGNCKVNAKIHLSLADLHFFEEPCISGKNGSGTVFFMGCNMHCKFCQNYEISQLENGKIISEENLSIEFLKLQEKGAHNINLVTACMYVPQLIKSLKSAKKQGLKIPIVYNSSAYEKRETLVMLEGLVDVFLPDLKYYYDDLAKELSGVEQYFEVATKAIMEMYRQVGNPQFDENGMMTKGLMIRHLILPNHLQNTKQVLKWIHKNLPGEVYVSIMAQYFPEYKAKERKDINRKLTEEEYQEIRDFVEKLEIQNGYMQGIEEDEKKYVPKWYT